MRCSPYAHYEVLAHSSAYSCGVQRLQLSHTIMPIHSVPRIFKCITYPSVSSFPRAYSSSASPPVPIHSVLHVQVIQHNKVAIYRLSERLTYPSAHIPKCLFVRCLTYPSAHLFSVMPSQVPQSGVCETLDRQIIHSPRGDPYIKSADDNMVCHIIEMLGHNMGSMR